MLGGLGVAVGGGSGVRCLQLAFVLLGSAAACSLDEAAAAVVAACPMGRVRRVALRAVAASVDVLIGAALLALWSLRAQIGRALVLELLGCAVLGFSGAALARTWLEEPGEAVASSMALALLGVLLIEPVGRRLGLFPVEGGAHRASVSWGLVMLCGAVVLAVVVPERRWREPLNSH